MSAEPFLRWIRITFFQFQWCSCMHELHCINSLVWTELLRNTINMCSRDTHEVLFERNVQFMLSSLLHRAIKFHDGNAHIPLTQIERVWSQNVICINIGIYTPSWKIKNFCSPTLLLRFSALHLVPRPQPVQLAAHHLSCVGVYVRTHSLGEKCFFFLRGDRSERDSNKISCRPTVRGRAPIKIAWRLRVTQTRYNQNCTLRWSICVFLCLVSRLAPADALIWGRS